MEQPSFPHAPRRGSAPLTPRPGERTKSRFSRKSTTSARWRVGLPVTVEAATTTVGTIVNLSDTGCAIHSRDSYTVGQAVRLSCRLSSRMDLSVRAYVRWTSPTAWGVEFCSGQDRSEEH